MTKSEASALLGVAEEATLADVRRRYQALHNDYQIRLTNAPTPALKKTYQQKLQELSDASDVLFPGFAAGETGGDLPSAEPVIVEPAARRPSVPPRPPSRGFNAEAPVPAPPPVSTGLPRSTLLAGIAAVVLAALLSFVGLRWVQDGSRIAGLESEHEKAVAAATSVAAKLEGVTRLLHNDRLRVRNLSSRPLRIAAAAFIYQEPSGAFKLAHSGNFDYPTWDVRPNAIVSLDPEMARGRLWDGPVIYYSLLVEYPGVEPFLKAGIWAEDIDRLDKVVSLDLD